MNSLDVELRARTLRTRAKNDLLPHFTVTLAFQLQERIRQRVHEDAAAGHLRGLRVKIMPEDLDHRLPFDLVSRIYRTQLKEAKATLSFADAMIAYADTRRTIDTGRALERKPAERLIVPFSREALASH